MEVEVGPLALMRLVHIMHAKKLCDILCFFFFFTFIQPLKRLSHSRILSPVGDGCHK